MLAASSPVFIKFLISSIVAHLTSETSSSCKTNSSIFKSCFTSQTSTKSYFLLKDKISSVLSGLIFTPSSSLHSLSAASKGVSPTSTPPTGLRPFIRKSSFVRSSFLN